MDWSITGGDVLQVLAFVVMAVIFVLRIDKQVGIMKAELQALEKRLNTVEQGVASDIKDIKNTLGKVFDKLDKKADK